MYSLNLPDDLKEAAEIERRGLRNIIKKTIRFSKKQRCLLTPIRKKTNEDVEKRNKSEDGLPVLETMDTQNDSDVPQREIDGKLVGALIKDSDESFDTFNRFSAWMVDETKRWSYRDADNCHWEVSIRLQSPEASYNDLAPVELDEAPEHSIRLNSCEPTGMATVANIKQLTKRRMPYDGGEINTDPSTKKWTRGLDCGATCVNHHGVSSTSDFERIYFDEDEKTRPGRSATLTILSRKPDVAKKPAPSSNHQTKRVNYPFTFRMADKRRTRIMIPNRHWAEELAHDEFHMANGNFIHLMVAELFALQEVQQCSANFEVPPVLGVTPRSPEEVVPTKWKSNETVLNLIDRAIIVGSEQLSQTKMQTSSQQLSASLFTGSMESEYEDTNDPVDVSEQAISPCEVIEAEERIVPVVCVPNKESRHCGDNSDSDVTRASQTSALLIAHALKKRVHTQIQSSQTVTLGDSDKTPKSKPMHQGKDIHKLLAYFALSRSTKTNSINSVWLPRCISEILRCQEVGQLPISLTKTLLPLIYMLSEYDQVHTSMQCRELVDAVKLCAQAHQSLLPEQGVVEKETFPNMATQEPQKPCSSDRIWLPRCFSEMLQPQEVEQLQKSLNEIIHSVGSTHEMHPIQLCEEIVDVAKSCAQGRHTSLTECGLIDNEITPSILNQEMSRSSDRIWLPRCFSEMLQPQEVEQLQKSLNEIIHSVGSTHEVHSNQQCKELLDTGSLCAQAHHSSMAEQELNGEKKSPSIVTQEVQKPCSSDRIWLPRCFSEMLQPQEVEQLQKSLNEIIHSVGSTHEESHQMHPCHQCKGLAELMNLCAQAHRLSSTDHGLRSEEACPSVLTQEINRDQRIKRLSDAVEQCIHSRLSVAEKNTISEQRPSNANPVELSAEDRAESEVNIVMSPEISMTSEQRQKWNGGDALNLPHTPEMNQTKYLFEPHELTLCRTASLEAQKGSVAPECKSPLWFPQYIDHSVGDFTNKDTDTYRYLEKNLTAEETRYIDSSRVFTPLCSPQVDFMRPLFELRELSLNKSTLFNPEFNKSSEQLLPTSSIFQHIDSAMDVEADDNLRCPRRSEHQSTVTGSMSFMDLPQDHYAHCEMDTHSLCNPQQSASESLVDRLESTGSLEIQKNQSPTLLMPSLYVTAADKPSKPFKRLISSPEGDLILREPRRRSHSTLLIRTQKEEQVAIRSTKLIWEEYKKRFPSSPRKQSLSLWILNFEEPVFQQEVLNEPKPKPRPMSVDAYKYAVSVTKNHQNRQNVQEINPVTIDMTKSPNSKVLFEPSSYVTYDSTTASSSQLHESVSVPESEFSTPIPNAPTLDLRSASDFSAYKSIPMGLVLVRTEPNLKKTVLIDRLYRLTRQTGKQCDVRIITFSDCGLHVVCLSAGNKNVQEIQSQSVSDTYGVPSDQGTNRTKLAVSTTLVPEP